MGSKLAPLYESAYYRIRSWKDRVSSTMDDYEKFIYLWISFNALYEVTFPDKKRVFSRKGYDITSQKSIFSFLINHVPKASELANQILQNNESLVRVLLDPKQFNNPFVKVSQEKLSQNSFKNPINRLDEVVKIIYAVRCRLFHGSKTHGLTANQEVLEACNEILDSILCDYFDNIEILSEPVN